MDDLDQTRLAQWQKNNDAYLEAALNWLRLRLERIAGPLVPTIPAAPPARGHFFERRSSIPANSFGVIPSPKTVTDADIKKAANAMQAAETPPNPQTPQAGQGGSLPPPALLMLSQLLELSPFEQQVLFLCIAMELDTTIATLCARVHGDANRPYPTFALALAVFVEERSWDILSPERPLRHWRLIEINQPGAQPLTTSALRADERIVNYVKGLQYLDDRLASLVVPLEVDKQQVALPASQQNVVAAIMRRLQQASSTATLPVIQLIGPDAPSKQLVARQAAARFGRHLVRMPIEMLPTQAADLETLARLWQRESILLPWALYLDAQEVDGSSATEVSQAASALTRFLARSEGFFFVGTREMWPHLGRPHIALDVAMPTTAEQKAAWTAALGTAAAENSGLLSSQFNLNLAAIQNIAQAALAEKPADEQALAEKLWDACRVSTRPRLDALAQRLEPKATWDDLVLPDEETNTLHQITDQVRQRSRVYEEWGFANKMNRGLGINALFAGESGTGKTMAAEVMANDLRLNLYRIDLSAVVSKYIGETEKNLRRLFDAAESGGAILFFDEADALFGKRSEVKDSHDRYANIEINYLLQRMEAYKGLAILATNMKNALDPAFMRRLRFIVNFPFPGPAERKRMWRKVYPKDTPINGLDYDWLAHFNLTGGSIHNIALNAAFLAARESSEVTMPLVVEAARTEFRKLERPVNEADFRWKVLQGASV